MKKGLIRWLSLLLCLLVFVSCNTDGNGTEESSTQGTSKYVPSANELLLVADGETHCVIVRPKVFSKTLMSFYSDLAVAIQQKTGVSVVGVTDTTQSKDGLVEILIGDTNRPESTQAKEKLGDFEYSVSVINGKVVVVGSDEVMLEKAIQYLGTLVGQEVWTIAKNYDQKIDGSNYLFYEYFGKDFEFQVEHQQINKMSIPTVTAPSGQKLSCVQGGCTDGTYTYACLVNATEDDPSCMIVKYDLKTQNRVAVSQEYKLDHANDMAYNPDEHILLVAHCNSGVSPENACISVIDPDTLALKETISLTAGSDISITYNRETKQYITIGVQNNYVYIYDRDFKLIRTIQSFGISKGQYKGDYLMQGIETDGTYLYIFDWHGGSEFYPNLKSIEDEISTRMHVMDLATGKHVETIELGIKREIENVGLLDGKLYIWSNNFSWTGAEFYIAEITPKA